MVHDVVSLVTENLNEIITNVIRKFPSISKGMVLADGSLVIMAMLLIFFGSYQSINHRKAKFKENIEYKRITIINLKAVMFPLKASFMLFVLNIMIQIDGTIKSRMCSCASGYIIFLGVKALTNLLSPVVEKLTPEAVPNTPYHIHFKKGQDEEFEDIINYRFFLFDVVSLICSLAVGAWYIVSYHWIAINFFGIAFVIRGLKLLYLKNLIAGCLFLCGFFLHDIFWVFGTNVMSTVTKSFKAPIKIVFPTDLLTYGFSGNNFSILGLGDILVPGIFIAFLLRFDISLNRNSKTYFYATSIAYFVGLAVAICMKHITKHTQPALLYLVPACLGTPIILALFKGDLKAIFKFEDNHQETLRPQEKNVNFVNQICYYQKNQYKSSIKCK